MTELLHATHCLGPGTWPRDKEAATVTLAYADRCRRRIRLVDDAGKPFLLNLERPQRLAEGDGLALTDGTFVRVIAAQEKLLRTQGIPEAQIVETLKVAASMQNPYLQALFGAIGTVVTGVVVSLVAAVLVKKKD